jgi:hypothetical protein
MNNSLISSSVGTKQSHKCRVENTLLHSLGVASSLRRVKSKSPDLCKRRRLLFLRRRLEPTPSEVSINQKRSEWVPVLSRLIRCSSSFTFQINNQSG